MAISPVLKQGLLALAERYESPDFIAQDPISLPHRFNLQQDREIIAFWVSILAWGRRSQIIQSGERLLAYMDNAPYQFICQHEERDREVFLKFKHRTFQPEDALYFLSFLQAYYRQHHSLEWAFVQFLQPDALHIGPALEGFHEFFFSGEHLARTRKHLPTPRRKAACKRLCMFLRWMVRSSAGGVDFGLWKGISPRQLLLPLDVHVERWARHWGLLKRPKADWLAVLELSEVAREICPQDPCRLDFALFGAGVSGLELV